MAARFVNPPDDVIRDILATPKTVAVVGCSSDPSRDSHRIARLLQQRGHRVIPVNPTEREVLGETCYPSLQDVPEPIGMVDVFRRPKDLAPHLDDLLAKRPGAVWLQEGIRDDAFAEALLAAGIDVVQDRCLMVEHRRLAGG